MKYKYDSFVLHYEQYKIVETLSLNYEQKGRLLDLIFGYAKDGSIPSNTPDLVKGAFAGIKVRMDEDREKYNAKRERMDKINEDRRNDDNARNRDEIVTKSHENGSTTVPVAVPLPSNVPFTGVSTDTYHMGGGGSPKIDKNFLSEVDDYINRQIKEGKEGFTFTAYDFLKEQVKNGMLTKKGQPKARFKLIWRDRADKWAKHRAKSENSSKKNSSGVRYDNESTNYKDDEL